MGEMILEIKDLTVEYKTDLETVHAVNGLSFSLEKGKTIGLVGETGAGKTTTALAIMALLPEKVARVTDGTIAFDGQEMSNLPEKNLRLYRGSRMSMIFQDPMTSLNPVMTVGQQISEAIYYHMDLPEKEREQRVEQMLEMVGIPAQRKNEYPHQFSGGMKQRVVIAIALACSPELLIADEPTTALDVTIQAQILELMRSLREELNTSMIFISHDLAVISEICDNVAIMYAGEIIEMGSVRDIYLPGKHHPYTVGLFNSIPSLDDETDRLHPISGLMPDPTNLPQGCKFHPRCEYCTEQCRTQEPPVISNGTHMVRCHRYANGEAV